MTAIVRASETAGLAVSLESVKAHANVAHSADDDLISDQISAVVRYLEDQTAVTFLDTEFIWHLDSFSARRSEHDDFWFTPAPMGSARSTAIALPRYPVKSVNAVSYLDSAGNLQTIDAANYQSDVVTRPGRIAPVPGYVWPSVGDYLTAVKIEFTAGYGDTPAAVPKLEQQAVCKLVAFWYANREAFSGYYGADIPHDIQSILDQLNLWSL